MKRFLAGYVIPFNAFASLMFLVIGGYNLTLPEQHRIGFWSVVLASYALVIGVAVILWIAFLVFHLLDWLDDWSRS